MYFIFGCTSGTQFLTVLAINEVTKTGCITRS